MEQRPVLTQRKTLLPLASLASEYLQRYDVAQGWLVLGRLSMRADVAMVAEAVEVVLEI